MSYLAWAREDVIPIAGAGRSSVIRMTNWPLFLVLFSCRHVPSRGNIRVTPLDLWTYSRHVSICPTEAAIFFLCLHFGIRFEMMSFFCSDLPLVIKPFIDYFLLHKVNKTYRIRVFFIWLISVAPNLRYSYLKIKIAFFLWKIDLKSKINPTGL